MAELRNTPAATEGNTITFGAVDVPFDWTNEDWSLAHLPWVRAAKVILQKDQPELTAILASMVQEGIAPDILEELASTKVHLESLVELLDTALARQFIVLERLGYSPDLPPPSAAEMRLAN